ncbi:MULTISPECIES: tRNA 2-thiocytidine(32) synthetase TtcA [Candidatus Ichthyocystis]|uniref:tRNA-cytidine(32) 2-sulfurtransferase n=1 Tax=Candidatus Ichthyocystis hellenicum TaxID=1561003 RepID=A0A0S4M5G9_9BURK|nr:MULTISPECIES: tRNA 2-thiocytidine(32) synthetase TtcA [Ichthyocystis]CUT17384.1 tRNA 2-thiocytidine biosynthesis protein TtcA [Candidatus Ichthyocystis hellenicum]
MSELLCKQKREHIKLEKRIRRQIGQAINDFSMIENGDRVMVCLSGGKDSYTLLDILLKLSHISPIKFDIIAVNVDQGHPGFPKDTLPNYVASLGVPFHCEYQNTLDVVNRVLRPQDTKCSLCSRLRRGILYRLADELEVNKIALGHHRDDIIETFFLNLFFGGALKAMPPRLVSDDGSHVVIRPLAYVAEEDTIRWSEHRKFPIIPCNLCGSQENMQRAQIKSMLSLWRSKHPGRIQTIFRSLFKIVPSHLLDLRLAEYENLRSSDHVICNDSSDVPVSPIQWVL